MCHKRHITGRVSGQDGASHTYRVLLILVATVTEETLSVSLNTHFSWICRLSEALSGWPTATSQGWHSTESLLTSFRAFLYTHVIWAGTDVARLNVSCISEEGYRKQETLRVDPIRRPWHCCPGERVPDINRKAEATEETGVARGSRLHLTHLRGLRFG